MLLSIIVVSCDTPKTKLATEEQKQAMRQLQLITKDGTTILDSTQSIEVALLLDKITEKWKKITSEQGNFSVEFPNFNIKEGQTTQILDGEEIIIYHYSIDTQSKNHENLGYRVDYTFLPEVKSKEQIEELFDIQRDYLLTAVNGTLIYENIIDTLTHPGRQLSFNIEALKMNMRYRILFNDGIFYKLMVVTKDEKIFNRSITRFLDSFKLLE
jgi:hypothetical protein